MSQNDVIQIIQKEKNWKPPTLDACTTKGDMPGDKVQIYEGHIEKANVIFPKLMELLPKYMEKNEYNRAVVAVCGGSGVGKSGVASVLCHYFKEIGIGCYTLSGDNYPRRIPMYNDAERLHIFRESGLHKMIEDNVYSMERFQIVQKFQEDFVDADPSHVAANPWYSSYLEGGKEGLKSYLGTPQEINFDELTKIVSNFKSGADKIYLKRMGRTETELWYEETDFEKTNLLLVEWTHGNSDYYSGVDIPILLNSTPEETVAYRKARNRDGAADAPFTATVLDIEQKLLASQAHKAQIIVSKSGQLLSYDQYGSVMQDNKS